MTIIDVIFKAIDWILENVSGKLKWILLAAVALVVLVCVLLKYRESIASFLNKFTTAKTHKTEYLTKGPVRVREKLLFRDKLVKKQSKQIRKAMKTKHNKFLIHGFGGVGKTAVAVELYDKLENKCERIGWVECGENGDLKASLLKSIDTEKEKKTDEERFSDIEKRLQERRPTILFLDNVDKFDPLLRELTRYPLTVIVTSRMEHVDGYTSIPIPPLSEDECVELFRSYCSRTVTKQDEPVVRELVRLVSCHTLSVELLAKGVPWGMDMAAYRDRLQAEGFGFPGLKFSTGHDQEEKEVVEHLRTLFDMAKLNEEQTRVMQNLALMADSRTLPAEVEDWIGCDENVLDGLVRTGWLIRTEDENKRGGYEVHPIVREIVLLDEVPVAAVEKFFSFATSKSYIEDGEDYRAVQFKLGIVEAVLEKAKDKLDESRDTAALYTRLGNVYDDQGEYAQAEKYHQEALAIALKMFEEDDPDTASCYNNLGNVYVEQGEYTQAEECHRKALNIRLQVLGEDDPDTASSYNNLGNVYDKQGKYAQAEDCNRKTLSIRLKVLGEDDPDTASSYNNLGIIYRNQGKYAQAIECHRKALNIRLKMLGMDHPDTATSYNNLGIVYRNQRKYAQAIECHRKALNIWLKVLGTDHPDTAMSYDNLGSVYGSQEKYTQAEECHRKALNIRLKVLGEKHPDTATSYNNLGVDYEDQKNILKQ